MTTRYLGPVIKVPGAMNLDLPVLLDPRRFRLDDVQSTLSTLPFANADWGADPKAFVNYCWKIASNDDHGT